jgi:TatD DNase family protein
VAAIGEIGLDYYRDRTPRPAAQVFLEQLLWRRTGPAGGLHNRQAAADMLPILQDWQAGLAASGSASGLRPGVLHSYSEDLETALRAVEYNFYIGITGPVTFKNARAFHT